MEKEETNFKIRTGEQLERFNYLVCFKSKSAIAEMLIDTEEKITKAIDYIEKESAFLNDDEYEVFNKKELLEILKGKSE